MKLWGMGLVQSNPKSIIATMKKLLLVIALTGLSIAPAYADFIDGVYAYNRGEYEQAYNTMRSLAETSGDGLAGYYVAMMYLRGQGVEQSHEEAAKWFRKAAQQGIKQAQFQLAELYMGGKGVPRDYEYAYAWYRTGAENRHTKSANALAAAKENLSEQELEEAEKLARKFIRQYIPKEEKPAGNQ